MTAKTKRTSSADPIPVWFIAILGAAGYSQDHLRLSPDVAKWLAGKLRRLQARKKIRSFRISRVDDLVIPAFMLYRRYGFDQ